MNIVPKQRNCESREDMIAAKIPAVTSPLTTGSAIKIPTIFAKTAPPGVDSGSLPVAHKPIKTQGTHTIIMHSG